ncbi:MAG: tetratricopeptide repeat protein, partial [Candidatus Zixiibacteriota bacterium]
MGKRIVNSGQLRVIIAAAICSVAVWIVGCSTGRSPALIRADVSISSDDDARMSEAQRSRQVSLDHRAYHHYLNGLMFEGLGDWEHASESYEKALASFPESHEIAYSYARSLYQLRKPHEAIDVLQQVNLDDPRHLRFAARCYHDMGMPDSVRVLYVRLAQIDSLDSRTYSFLAGMYRQRRDIDSTVWAYRNLVRIRPDNIGYLNELADLLAQQNKFPDAREMLHRSLEVEFGPTNIRAVHALGELYLMDSLFDSAAFTFQRGLEVEPDNLMLYQQLAMAYIRMDSLQAALMPAHRIVELSPRNLDAVRRLGILYYSLDSLDVADSVLSSLVASGDRNATNHFYLGRIAALKDNWYRARDEFIRRTEMADTLSDSWLDLGLAYRRL